jgi:predicted dehydrogenase
VTGLESGSAMKVAIVGAGLIGHKRAAALGMHQLVACVDVSLDRARALAERAPGCLATADLASGMRDAEVVIVATTHDALAPTALAAIEAGKHVLLEKPAARSAAELQPLVDAALRRGVVARVGFNHRFHPALKRARRLFARGVVGELTHIRGRYGHGGRPGYDREWRAVPAISGGGELLDQGTHLIDLARWFAGDFVEVSGRLATYFWDMPVEDNAFLLLASARGQVAWLHASWTEWKNLFSFEVFGRTGKLQIDGLGGSYGTERLTLYRMLPELGPPLTRAWEFPGEDRSWHDEFADFARCIQGRESVNATLDDALAALSLIDRLYAGAGR